MRNKNNTTRFKNELPELLEAVINHPDCPDWLRESIWECINDHSRITFSADYIRLALASAETDEQIIRQVNETSDGLRLVSSKDN